MVCIARKPDSKCAVAVRGNAVQLLFDHVLCDVWISVERIDVQRRGSLCVAAQARVVARRDNRHDTAQPHARVVGYVDLAQEPMRPRESRDGDARVVSEPASVRPHLLDLRARRITYRQYAIDEQLHRARLDGCIFDVDPHARWPT